jgi:hypothetical protein
MPSLRTVKFATDFSKITAANAEYSFAPPRNRKLVRRKYSNLILLRRDLSALPVHLLEIPGSSAASPPRAMRVIDDGNRIGQNAEAKAGPNPVAVALAKG